MFAEGVKEVLALVAAVATAVGSVYGFRRARHDYARPAAQGRDVGVVPSGRDDPPPPDLTPNPAEPPPSPSEPPNPVWQTAVDVPPSPTVPQQATTPRWYARRPNVSDGNFWRRAEPLPAIPGTPVRSATVGTWWQRQQPDVEHEADNASSHAVGRSGA